MTSDYTDGPVTNPTDKVAEKLAWWCDACIERTAMRYPPGSRSRRAHLATAEYLRARSNP